MCSLGWSNYGARFYDPAIARFTTIDPLAEKYSFQTPYAYAANNPIRYIDWMGMGPEDCCTGPITPIISISKVSEVISEGWYSLTHPGRMQRAQLENEATAIENGHIGPGGEMIIGSQRDVEAMAGFADNAATVAEIPLVSKFIRSTSPKGTSLKPTIAQTEAPKSGGRLGNASTRKQNSQIASEMESRGFEITGGGGRFPEEYIPPLGGGRKGGSYPDITATKGGRTVRVNTVDTKSNGSMTSREAANAARIRTQRPNDHLLTIPNSKN